MPSPDGARVNWFNRYWHDWPDVCHTVYEVAKAHARYLGYEVHMAFGCDPPPEDLRDVGPVIRVKVIVFRHSGKHRQPERAVLTVDVERRAGKFHVKTTNIESD